MMRYCWATSQGGGGIRRGLMVFGLVCSYHDDHQVLLAQSRCLSSTPLSVLDPKGSATIEKTYEKIEKNLHVRIRRKDISCGDVFPSLPSYHLIVACAITCFLRHFQHLPYTTLLSPSSIPSSICHPPVSPSSINHHNTLLNSNLH